MMFRAYSSKISVDEINLENAVVNYRYLKDRIFYFKINQCQRFLDNSYLFGAIQFIHVAHFKNNVAKCFTMPD